MADDQFADRYLIREVILERDYVVRSIAIDRILGREVLITQLSGRVGRRSAVQERFRTAAREAVRLSHPNIVALYDIGLTGGMPYSVQEHAHSETLREIIASEGPFHPDDVAVLVEHVAAALDYAALRGSPHLGLSPEAITVDYDGLVLVSDFGIGQVLAEIGPVDVASLRYRAPEQVSGSSGDYRSDIYALGIIAYEMVTNASPFDTTSSESVRQSIASGRIDHPAKVNPEVPPAVSDIIFRALEPNPRDRFESAGHLAEALSNWKSNLPVAGGRPRSSSILQPSERTEAMAVVPALIESDPAASDGTGQRGSRTTTFTAWLAIAVAVAALIWIGAALLDVRGSDDPPSNRGSEAGTPSSVAAATATSQAVPTAPSLIGQTVAEADAQTDLSVRVAATEPSESVPEGQIIRQIPNPGRPVRTGELAVIVSSGSGPQPIDLSGLNVVGSSSELVANQLIALGLNVIQLFEGSAEVAEGLVIRVEEESATPGSTVHIVVSMGDRVLITNDLQSMPLEDAVSYLEDSGLPVGEPIAVSTEQIESFGVDLDARDIIDGDVVGIQEETLGFGQWVDRGTTVTPVYYDSSLD
jgi:serine/threonine protein kinase